MSFDLNDGAWHYKLEGAGSLMTAEQYGLLSRCAELHQVVGIVTIEIKAHGQPNHYAYEFATTDGRKWKQDLDFSNPEVKMDFAMNNVYWAESEFIPHRGIRAAMISLIKAGATRILVEKL